VADFDLTTPSIARVYDYLLNGKDNIARRPGSRGETARRGSHLGRRQFGVTVVEGDAREVAATLEAVSAGIDRSRPVCLLMGALLHFFPADATRDLVASYVSALAPGSCVVLSVGRGDGDAANQGFRAYSSGGNQSYNQPVPDFTSFFGDLTLVSPGIVDARQWHPDPGEEGPFPPRSGYTIAGVARVG
jgi:S-adenosyl methyltransferase